MKNQFLLKFKSKFFLHPKAAQACINMYMYCDFYVMFDKSIIYVGMTWYASTCWFMFSTSKLKNVCRIRKKLFEYQQAVRLSVRAILFGPYICSGKIIESIYVIQCMIVHDLPFLLWCVCDNKTLYSIFQSNYVLSVCSV